MTISLPEHSRMKNPDFTFGVATSSYQIEGSADSRLPNIWDRFCRMSGKIADGSDGQIACDHVNRWREDIDLIADLGVDAYRFSISWPRVTHADGSLNRRGLAFYEALVEKLARKGIKSYATLYHWDLPQHIEDEGGWLNRDTAYRFRDYADQVTAALGGRVHSYATLNEPFCSARLGYGLGVHAPGIHGAVQERTAAHHLFLAHGLAMERLNANAPDSLNGIVLNFTPSYAASESEDDRVASQLADEELNQWYFDPIILGRYPDLITRLPEAERPPVHPGDMEIIAAPLGFLGINYYTRAVYQSDGNGGYQALKPDAPVTDFGWEIYPQGLTDLLISLHEKAELPPVFIAENGAAMPDDSTQEFIDDMDRTRYIESHLEAIDRAIRHGVNVRGYFCWSLMDNFEWAEGYAKRFGLYRVDFESQKRTLKRSGRAYRDMLARRRTANNGAG